MQTDEWLSDIEFGLHLLEIECEINSDIAAIILNPCFM